MQLLYIMVVCEGEPLASEILPGVWLGTETHKI